MVLPAEAENLPAWTKEALKSEVFSYARKGYLTVWYNVAAFLEGATDKLREEYVKYPWIWEFLPPAKSPSGLQATRREFETNPTLTLDILKAFAKSFTYQEIGIQMCKQCEHPTCFLYICNGLRKGISRLGSSHNTTVPDEKRGTYYFSATSGVTDNDIVAEHTKVSDDIIARLKEYDNTYWTPGTNPDNAIQRSEIMRKVLEDAGEYWGVYTMSVVEQFHEAIDFLRSQHLSTDSEASDERRLASKEVNFESHSAFHRNLVTFTEMMSGRRSGCNEHVDFYYRQLENTGAARNQHLQPILEEIGRLRDTVETQRQIITSLGYRRLIEHLPNKSHYDSTLALHPYEKNSTRYWCEIWRGLVVKELNNMINKPPGTPATPPRPLTQLFKYNFEAWRNKTKNKSATVVPSSEYENWPGYKRGLQLYGELSGTIHQYNDTSRQLYKIKDSNWSKSDRVILAALQPSHFVTLPDGSSDVDWDKERQKHGLP